MLMCTGEEPSSNAHLDREIWIQGTFLFLKLPRNHQTGCRPAPSPPFGKEMLNPFYLVWISFCCHEVKLTHFLAAGWILATQVYNTRKGTKGLKFPWGRTGLWARKTERWSLHLEGSLCGEAAQWCLSTHGSCEARWGWRMNTKQIPATRQSINEF